MNNDKITLVLLGVVFAILGFALVWMFNTNVKIEKVMENQATLEKHWRLHGWARDEINALRSTQSLPMARWPDLH